MITASMLYNYVQCPHRMTLDLFGEAAERDSPNAFVELLWERGVRHEEAVVARLAPGFVDCSAGTAEEREVATLNALAGGAAIIYQGRIQAADLVGEPDILRREGAAYAAVDIKSGSGEEGPEDDRKPKRHYAVQLALYTDILERLGYSAGRRACVIDRTLGEVVYDFTLLQGVRTPQTLWDFYQETLTQVRALAVRQEASRLALASKCALCHWYSKCSRDARASDDLTLLPYVGRAKRDSLIARLPTVKALAECDPEAHIQGKKTAFRGIGPDTLRTLAKRAWLLRNPDHGAYLKSPVAFPEAALDLYFDIEADPLNDVCYLHGFLERPRGSSQETYYGFFIEEPTPGGERDLFAQAVRFLEMRPDRALYYYSSYEPVFWRKLQERYPEVCSVETLAGFFDKGHAVDLYHDVVETGSEWPTNNFSIKTLAKYLGFAWRDENPSGAASIEWYARWEETRDPALRARLLEYNEDDCRATRVLLDALRRLPVEA